MIKKLQWIIMTAFCMVVVTSAVLVSRSVSETTSSDTLRILVAYNPKHMTKSGHILVAYTSVLEEEGIAFQTIDLHQLLAVDSASLARTVPAIIFPDALCQSMPMEFEPWIEHYLEAGGSIAAIYDPATKDTRGAYLPSTFFKKFSGINHVTYTRLPEKAYCMGELRFKDRTAAKRCEIPYGKLDKSLFLSGYGYGRLQYPVARNEMIPPETSHPAPVILAEAVVNQSETYPAIVTRRYKKGHVLYVNMPLGYLKANSDDLPLRSILRFFLFKTIKVPHMMNVPFGKGGIVINWHLDSNADWPYLDKMVEMDLFRDQLKYSMHITAGDSMHRPGDGLGFDACGQGERFVHMLKPFGSIGSHGGWHHNWFAFNAESGAFGEEDIKKYVGMNNQCLESLTGEKVLEYSAPRGVHPPSLMTNILSGMNISAYYYTGDSGSAPNRSFFQGKMLSDRMIAFPVMPFIDKASLAELDSAQTTETEIRHWLHRTADFAIENRTIRMLYSHPYDLYAQKSKQNYLEEFRSFLDYLEQAQATDRLSVMPMSHFSHFMLQMLEANCRYTVQPHGIDVHVQKAAGLNGLTLMFPKDRYQSPQGDNIQITVGMDAYYATLDSATQDTHFSVPTR